MRIAVFVGLPRFLDASHLSLLSLSSFFFLSFPGHQQRKNARLESHDNKRFAQTVTNQYFIKTITDNIIVLCPKFLVTSTRKLFPETIKLRIGGFFRAQKNLCRTCHYKVKCRKALWCSEVNQDFSCVRNMNSKALLYFLP